MDVQACRKIQIEGIYRYLPKYGVKTIIDRLDSFGSDLQYDTYPYLTPFEDVLSQEENIRINRNDINNER